MLELANFSSMHHFEQNDVSEPESIISTPPELDPLCLRPVPEHSEIWLIPDIHNQVRGRRIGFHIRDPLGQVRIP